MQVSSDDRRTPRLSSLLRACQVQGSTITQSSLLLSRQKKVASLLEQGNEAPGLTWKSFVGKRNPSAGLRQTFSKYMERCSELAEDSEQMVGERLEQVAFDLYNGFNSSKGLKRLDVEKMLGSRVKQSSVKVARELAKELHDWKQQESELDTSASRLPQEELYIIEPEVVESKMEDAGQQPYEEEEMDGEMDGVDEGASVNVGPWLREQCNLHVLRMEQAVMSGEDMANSIVSILGGSASDDEVQGQLLDLLGMSEESFEFIIQLISKRQAIAQSKTKSKTNQLDGSAAKRDRYVAPVFAPSSRTPQRGEDFQATHVRLDKNSPLERGAPKVALPNMRPGSRPAGMKEEQIIFQRITGPGAEGEGDEAKGRYVQVVVPAPKIPQRPGGEYRVPISSFGSLAQVAFRGIESLNRLQSAVFDAAYHTNNNLLICAPTGAGKTNVAMTCVVREIERHVEDIHKVKIIYVAPLKALAQEVVEKFGERLKPLGMKVRELTGDMQLTRHQIDQTQLIVTTPEKWDVITRKSGDGTLVESVGLLIIDEVHLVGEDRGPVIESLIARTLRLVEQKQKMVRIVGLSATLPNYRDVARFLRVDMHSGMFFFDNAYRPVPLDQTFIGVIEKNVQKKLSILNDLAFEKAADSVKRGHQAMIFVHSRKDTSKTARAILEAARKTGDALLFGTPDRAVNQKARNYFEKDVAKSKNSDLRGFFQSGIGIHHAGMLRADRSLTEKMFERGAISVLCCTATLAWGVNLPVHTVIVKGTQIYVAEKGGLVELNASDVFQAFGRAGRPQYDTSGEAVLITEHDQLNRYLSMLNNAQPLESSLDKHLPDALNAEIVSGTVTNLEEATEWLSYTFLHIRMIMNPLRYGITHKEKEQDPTLLKRRANLIVTAARELDRARMSRFALAGRRHASHMSSQLPDMQAPFGVTDLGRVASHFYIGHATIELFNSKMRAEMSDAQIIDLLCHASEFDQLKVREEEMVELGKLRNTGCAIEVVAPLDSPRGKAAVLLQCYITNVYISTFTLSSDMNYIAQNMARVARAVFEIALKKRWSNMAEKMLMICIALEKRCWWSPYAHPLRQFVPALIQPDTIRRLEDKGELCHVENLVEMEPNEIGHLIRQTKMGDKILRVVKKIPYLNIEAHLQPLTRSILRVTLDISADFEWNDRVHGSVQSFWFWVDDQNSEWIYHAERFTLRKADWKAARKKYHRQSYDDNDDLDSQDGEEVFTTPKHQHPALVSATLEATSSTKREFTIPIFEPLPPQYFLRIFSDSWFGSEAVIPLTLDKLVLPPQVKQHTDLLPLLPLPRSALKNRQYEALYERKFTHFNPIQTQAFHVLYHTDNNVLLGAPTGSGKTISAELALLRMFREYPGAKAVYIAPLKALVSERVRDWKQTIGRRLGKRVVEFTGDVTPNVGVLNRADVLITTPEKWDGATRMWQRREYIQKVKLVIIDEIHLLGEERGAVLEVLVTRMRYIAETSGSPVRIVGLSTALANAHDLANWLGIKGDVGLYNFRPAVRPVKMEAHIQGFPGKHYCPRMSTMNKPTYQAILTHSPTKPALVFVASRRQTRLTALDLIAMCAASENPRRFLNMPFEDLEALLLSGVSDETLKHTLAFGIGIHHAGLDNSDRELVEDLYVNGKIQVLVCTSTLAWGVNFPAHLVVIKGTEYYDAKSKRYQPFPVTDVLQMMGRAGRPQFDDSGVAMIFVEESLKDFYKKFLYEPFPVESHLAEFLHNHLNAEIAAGSVASEREALDYLSWTYFFRRLPMNPSYYGLESSETDAVAVFLMKLIRQIFSDLKRAGCVTLLTGALTASVERSKASGTKSNWETAESLTAKADKDLLDRKLKNIKVQPTDVGKIASFYYLDYRSMEKFGVFFASRKPLSGSLETRFRDVLAVLSDAHEYSEVPVRHNEDELNLDLSQALPWSPFIDLMWTADSPHAKAFLLFQVHCKRAPAPIKDYINDTKSVLDQSMRVLNALVELTGVYREGDNLDFVVAAVRTCQCLIQGLFWDDSPLSQFRGVKSRLKSKFASSATPGPLSDLGVDSSLLPLVSLASKGGGGLAAHLKSMDPGCDASALEKEIGRLPLFDFTSSFSEPDTVEVSLRLRSSSHSPCIPFGRWLKSKDYAWWVVLASGNKVVGLKHVMGLPKSNEAFTLSFKTSSVKPTHVVLLSASVQGIDQVASF